jgi:hypothetical protein
MQALTRRQKRLLEELTVAVCAADLFSSSYAPCSELLLEKGPQPRSNRTPSADTAANWLYCTKDMIRTVRFTQHT